MTSKDTDTSNERQPQQPAGGDMVWVGYAPDLLGVFSLCAHAFERLSAEQRGRILRALAIIFESEATP